jgi:hypothetical protein
MYSPIMNTAYLGIFNTYPSEVIKITKYVAKKVAI